MKLTKEDIKKYGTEDEKEDLKEIKSENKNIHIERPTMVYIEIGFSDYRYQLTFMDWMDERLEKLRDSEKVFDWNWETEFLKKHPGAL